MSEYNTNWFVGDGNLVKDHEERETKNGNKLVKFRIAIKNGEKKTTFIDCEWWSPTGAVQYLKKGKKVSITGNLLFDEWEKNGEKRSKCYINVQHLRLADNKTSKSKEDYQREDFEAELDSLIQE